MHLNYIRAMATVKNLVLSSNTLTGIFSNKMGRAGEVAVECHVTLLGKVRLLSMQLAHELL
jgi:hypothetical protein